MALTLGDPIPELDGRPLHHNVRVSIIERFLVARYPEKEDAFEGGRKVWLTAEQAIDYTQRSRRTIQTWDAEGLVASRMYSDGRKRYNKLSLFYARKRAEFKYAHRRVVAGPGRGHTLVSPA